MKIACAYCSFLDAEEIVHDVFVKLYNTKRPIDEIDNIKSYLFISTKNQCLNHLRKKKIDNVIDDNIFEFLIMESNSPQYLLEYKQIEQDVDDVIESLPPKCRQVFDLVVVEGKKYKEVAKILDISLNTVNVHIKKAIKRVMDVIKSKKIKFE